MLLLLRLDFRRGKGSNDDADVEDGARLTYLFVAALLKISSTPTLPFARRSKEGKGRRAEGMSVHQQDPVGAGQSQCDLCRVGKKPWNSLSKGTS